MKPVVIFGIGTFAELVHFYLSNDSTYEVAGFTVDKEYINDNVLRELPVIPFEQVETIFPAECYSMFIAIGYSDLNIHRAGKFAEAKAKGYQLISYTSSKSIVWPDLKIGENCFIMENNVIQPFVTIEDNVIIWSSNLISHGAYISKNSFITSHVVIGGGVTVGDNCFLGINSSVREYITIAKNCIIGANSFISRNTREDEAFMTVASKPSRMSSRVLKHFI